MNTTIKLLTLVSLICAGLITSHAGPDHKATPKGGRALDTTSPLAEFVVEKDRTVTINFYDANMKPVAVTTQTVTVIADAKEKVTLEFEKKGDSLASKAKLPDGEVYMVVVQFKQTAEAKPQNFRFKLLVHTCGECKRVEYACICGH